MNQLVLSKFQVRPMFHYMACVALTFALLVQTDAAAQYVVTPVMSGLDNPRGLAFGPDGGLYVAEAGRGGTIPTSIVVEGQSRFFGTTSALSRLLGGVQARVLTGLPSHATSSGETASGLHDIVFNSAGEAFGLMGLGTSPTGRASLGDAGAHLGHLVRLPLAGGSVQSIADVAAYEGAQNPDGGLVDSNPFKLLPNPAGGYLATDAGANSAFGVTAAGAVSTLSVLPPRPNPLPFGPPVFQSVPTAVALGPDGAYYIGELTGFPFPSGAANVYRLDPTTGARTVAHAGFTNIVDLTFDPAGNLYVLQISTNGLASSMGPGPGALIKVASGTGTRTTIASQGLSFPTGFTIGPDGAFYVSNMGNAAGSGQVLRLTLVSEPSSWVLFYLGMIAVTVRRATTSPYASTSPHNVPNDRTRNRFAHNSLAVLGALALIVLPSAASAVPLAPGNFVNLIGTTHEARPELGGEVLQDTIRPFSVDLGGGNFTSGMIQDRVVRETGSGTLDFSYRIVNDVSSGGSVDFVTRNSFAAFGADVDFRTDGVGTIGPDQASRNAAGDEVLFDFFSTNLLFPGAESFFVFVKTDATDFDENGTGSLAFSSNLGGGTFDFDTFQPVMAAGTLPGDFNRNGVVDATDYVVWRKGLGTTYMQTDYDEWRANFGQTAGSGVAGYPLGASAQPLSAAVPEPSSWVFFCMGMIAVVIRRTI